jgi:FkbM family methyltransferase
MNLIKLLICTYLILIQIVLINSQKKKKLMNIDEKSLNQPHVIDSEVHSNKWVVTRIFSLIDAATQGVGTVLIIGANVGNTGTDAVWSTIVKKNLIDKVFVEPVPPIFKKLQNNVQNHGLNLATCVNVAISQIPMNLTIYCAGANKDGSLAAGFPLWILETCSTMKESLYTYVSSSNRITEVMIDNTMLSYMVPSMTVEDLIKDYASKSPIRVITIDIEGLDDEVLLNLPLDSIAPDVIIYEFIHLSQQQYEITLNFLHKHGYYTFWYYQNTVAYKPSLMSKVDRKYIKKFK